MTPEQAKALKVADSVLLRGEPGLVYSVNENLVRIGFEDGIDILIDTDCKPHEDADLGDMEILPPTQSDWQKRAVEAMKEADNWLRKEGYQRAGSVRGRLISLVEEAGR